VFQGEILQSKFLKVYLKTVSVLKVAVITTCAVRLGTAIGKRHTPMAAGLKSDSTIGNIDHPQLFAQP
jgi:hypothetical protein